MLSLLSSLLRLILFSLISSENSTIFDEKILNSDLFLLDIILNNGFLCFIWFTFIFAFLFIFLVNKGFNKNASKESKDDKSEEKF